MIRIRVGWSINAFLSVPSGFGAQLSDVARARYYSAVLNRIKKIHSHFLPFFAGMTALNFPYTILSNWLIPPVLSNSTRSESYNKQVLRLIKCVFHKQCQLQFLSGEKYILSSLRSSYVFCVNLIWQKLKVLVELANLTVYTWSKPQ